MTDQKVDTVEQLRLDVRHDLRWLSFGMMMNTAAIVVLGLAVGGWFR